MRESSGEDAAFLSKEAIDFALEHKVLLGNDRDLDTLALAGVLALPANSVASLDYGKWPASYRGRSLKRNLKVFPTALP